MAKIKNKIKSSTKNNQLLSNLHKPKRRRNEAQARKMRRRNKKQNGKT